MLNTINTTCTDDKYLSKSQFQIPSLIRLWIMMARKSLYPRVNLSNSQNGTPVTSARVNIWYTRRVRTGYATCLSCRCDLCREKQEDQVALRYQRCRGHWSDIHRSKRSRWLYWVLSFRVFSCKMNYLHGVGVCAWMLFIFTHFRNGYTCRCSWHFKCSVISFVMLAVTCNLS